MSMGPIVVALTCGLVVTSPAAAAVRSHPNEPVPQPNSKQGFASGHSAEGCWFSAHKPFRLHTRDRYIHGESRITRCTTPPPVYCRIQSRLQMWIPYSGQWVQKGKWKDS